MSMTIPEMIRCGMDNAGIAKITGLPESYIATMRPTVVTHGDLPRFPGAWTVRMEQPWGFEITRALGGGESEWMTDETGATVVFDTEREAANYLASRT